MEIQNSATLYDTQDYKTWKKTMEKLRVERLEKNKKRQKDIEKIHFLKAQARREYNSNINTTGKIGPVSKKALEAYELQQMLMSEM
ncbi:MAG: hypothetical protein HDT39_12055 [Lachnospiraceae bacterium]|nr:hypothetical protein [Lachnospiraceae bacterium]